MINHLTNLKTHIAKIWHSVKEVQMLSKGALSRSHVREQAKRAECAVNLMNIAKVDLRVVFEESKINYAKTKELGYLLLMNEIAKKLDLSSQRNSPPHSRSI